MLKTPTSAEEALWMVARTAGMPRRRFLWLLGAGGASAVLASCSRSVPSADEHSAASALPGASTPPAVAQARGSILKPTPERDFIMHGDNNAEVRLERMAEHGYLTPNALFYVRNHGSTPLIDAKTFRLVIEGDAVDKRIELTYDDLLGMPQTTVTRCVECAGNGRVFYGELLKRPAQGDPWRFGAYGIAEWTGVPLGELLRRAGLKKTAVCVMPTGLDDAKGERPMPIEKALEDDTILAVRMNGEVLPPDHGFPARVIVSGWIGAACIKWVGSIRVSSQRIFVKMNTEAYVLISPDYPPEPPAKGPILTTQNVKSAVALPWPATLPAGKQRVTGYAWSPFGKIDQVDVSLDGGVTFQQATLMSPNIERAGVRWELTFDAKPGDLTITPRARDDKGHTQPPLAMQKWNEKGYAFAAMVPHPVKIAG